MKHQKAAKYGQFGMFQWILESETDKNVLYENSYYSFLLHATQAV